GYRLFCQPVLAGSRRTGTWALCGLRRSEALSHDTWAMPPWLVAVALCVLAAVVVAWPSLKLCFLGPGERLRATDVLLLVLSAVAGVGAATFLVAALYAAGTLRTELDGEAAYVGTAFGKHLQRELCQTAGVLNDFRNKLAVDGDAYSVYGKLALSGLPYVDALATY